MSPVEIEYLDYRFTATLETRETGLVAVVDWLEQLVSPKGALLVEIPAAQAAAAGAATSAVDSDTSTAEVVSDVVIEIVSDLDWIDTIAEWFTDGPE
ncbi:conserved hypothetical protein [Burkholderia diffusa]|uniref:hypothetical protein n=1 Tax=Burkholderia diffusa TaxID=488732 RepID=UPI001CB5C66C|nr:hypothetical protein [Burkholderia diffusa]CAG9253967.1 conserved hypothetical protein [Burkholderia diffusa]